MIACTPLAIGSSDLQLQILPKGAALIGLRFTGSATNMVLGFADPAHHGRVPIYAGAIVGPIANRVRGGRVVIEDHAYQMPLNEARRTTLHSGDNGLHTREWDVIDHAAGRVTLSCTLPDGACGLPGTRQFTATYHVEGSCLTLTLEARTDAATPINLAAHPYWNLDGGADVSGHRLEVFADHMLPTDAQNLPTGTQAAVAGTMFDFRTPRAVPLDPALDVNYCLSLTPHAALQPAARLTGANGTTLEIATTAPGLQVYNGAYLPADAPPTDGFPLLAPYAGIALEPQHWPDAAHHAHFPGIILLPQGHYTQQTRYVLSRR